MRVSIVSAGRFHAYNLAEQLRKMGCLEHLYTGYPVAAIDVELRPYARSFPWLYSVYKVAARLGWRHVADRLSWPARDTFDRWASRQLDAADLVVGLSGFGLHTGRTARNRGAVSVCDRGSSHIRYQDRLLAEEYALQGLPYKHIDRRVVERELQEYAEADLITVPSKFAYQSFIKEGVAPSKLTKVPYGVDLTMFRPLPKVDRQFRVVYVGQISVRKGIAYLLEAVCSRDLRSVDLVLIGNVEDEMKPVLARYEGRFRYLGVMPRADLARHYSQGSVFVIASVEEGLALVQAQALACGLPVVATVNTGAEDLFSDGEEGFIVPIRDPAAIRERVLRLYENPELRNAMSENALSRVRQMGGWDTYGAGILAAYQTALDKRSPCRASSGPSTCLSDSASQSSN